MNKPAPLRVAVLVDLLRSPQAGGHVKCWERLAKGAAEADLPLDLTVYFSGRAPDEVLSPRVRFRHLPQVFSTACLKFLPYVPDHTDLSPWHPRLARELGGYDVIHTTDGFFAFARTAARLARTRGVSLTSSFHTDTPSYARIFTQNAIEKIFGNGFLARKLTQDWRVPQRQGDAMDAKLRRHLAQCRAIIATRDEDKSLAASLIGEAHVHHMRRGVDRSQFNPDKADRAGIERDYGIPTGRIVFLFVGRVDVGKNIHTLAAAMETLIKEGLPVHLVVAGLGPMLEEIRARLGAHVSTPGFVAPEELARLYASVDALAVPSEVEIHSMIAVEAVASGCPTLIAGASGVGQLFHTPAMGIVDGGVAAWEQALRDFAGEPALRQSMRKSALDYGENELASWREVMAEDIFPVWRDAAAAPESRAA